MTPTIALVMVAASVIGVFLILRSGEKRRRAGRPTVGPLIPPHRLGAVSRWLALVTAALAFLAIVLTLTVEWRTGVLVLPFVCLTGAASLTLWVIAKARENHE
jgi:hypothetical protein